MKKIAYNKALNKILDTSAKSKRDTQSINPVKSILILFDGSSDKDRKVILKFSDSLKSKGKKVKLLSYINSKGELLDFGMAVYNNKSINFFDFPKKHILKLLESEKFDFLFNYNIKDHKHLHALACKATAAFKLSLPTKHPHDFTMIVNTKEKEDLQKIINETTKCLEKVSQE